MAREILNGGAGSGSDPIAIKADLNFAELYQADITLQENIDNEHSLITGLSGAGKPFMYTAKLTAIAAGTAVPLVPEAIVPTLEKIYLAGFRANVSGATAWSDITATQVVVADTATLPVSGLTIAKAGLTGNAVIDSYANANTVVGNAILLNTGFTAGKGLSVKADANFGAGSDLYVTVWGYIK